MRGGPEMTERRGAPVSLEEMTRRRDGWRRRWGETDRKMRVALVRNDLLEKQLEAARRRDAWNTAEIGRLSGELAAAQAEARRFAEECGRLRDQLALKDEEISRLIRLTAGQ
jgi:chromosome segregation ATPase